MTATTDTTGRPAPVSAPRSPGASLWALRILAALHMAVLAAQPLLAGLYLDGSLDAIGVHGLNAHIVQLMCFAQVIAAVLYAWPGGGRIWPLAASVALWFAEGLQLGMGYGRVLVVHILLGVSIVTLQALFTVWAWRRGARAARKRRIAR